MFIKKKIPNTQTKTKPSNPRTVTSPSSLPQRAPPRCRRNGGPHRRSTLHRHRRRRRLLCCLPSAPLPLRRWAVSSARQSLASLAVASSASNSSASASLKVFLSNPLSLYSLVSLVFFFFWENLVSLVFISLNSLNELWICSYRYSYKEWNILISPASLSIFFFFF